MNPPPLRFSLLAIFALGAVLSAYAWSRPPANQLRVVFPPLDGDAALVRTPTGQTVLIDGGADGPGLATWLGNALPFGQRRLDAVILTRVDSTTLPGQIAALKRYRTNLALLPSIEERSSSFEAWQQLIADSGNTPTFMQTGDRLRLGACNVKVLHESNGRAVLSVACGTQHVYFWQSIDADSEAALETQSLAPATLVVYPWQRSTQTPLLNSVQPSVIVFSEGEGTAQQTWQARKIGGAQLYHEALHGEITLLSDAGGTRVVVGRDETRKNGSR